MLPLRLKRGKHSKEGYSKQNPSKLSTHHKEGDSKQSPGPSSFLKKQTEQPSKEGTSKHYLGGGRFQAVPTERRGDPCITQGRTK
jgi:hypothetical protein